MQLNKYEKLIGSKSSIDLTNLRFDLFWGQHYKFKN